MTTLPDQSSSSNSVLTNVAPPSALPSFLTSPLPSSAPPPAPAFSPPSFPSNMSTVSSAGMSVPPASGVSVSQPFSSSATPPPNSSVSSVPLPSTSYSSIPGAGAAIPPPVSGGPSNSTFVPSKVSSFPVPSPPLPSHSATPVVDSVSAQTPSPSNTSCPVMNQPHPPNSPGSGDTSASVDIGSPGVVESIKNKEGDGWFGWIRGTVSNVGHRVAERAKTSMDSMITTLDPQMKEFIYSGGDMDVVVASDKEVKVGAIREAFQISFGKATVCGMKCEAEGVAAQPVGFEAALTSAEGRINYLRSTGRIHPQQPIIAVENFIVEFQPDCWFDLGLLLLDDPAEDIVLQTYTQVTPVPPDFVKQAHTATPDHYPLKESGFAVTIGQIASQNLQVPHTMWQEALTGVSRRESLVLAGRTLAGLYRSRLPKYH